MKKIFSLFAAMLFAGSMMATDVTITASDFAAVTSSDYSTTKSGVTVAVTSSTVTADELRIFKNQSITISATSNITKIEFTCTASGTAKYGPGCFAAQDGYTFEASGKKGTWQGSATSVEFTAESNQVRATQIVVTIDGGGDPIVPPSLSDGYYLVGSSMGWDATSGYQFDANPSVDGEYILNTTLAVNDELKVISYVGEQIVTWYPAGTNNNYVVDAAHAGAKTIYFRPAGNQAWATFHEGGYFFIEANLDPDNITTCYDARRAALSVSGNNVEYNNGQTYTIRGYVTSIATAYSSQYNNVSFWMADDVNGGQVLEAYRCVAQSADEVPSVGDFVEVTGKLTKYNSTPEFAAGCTCSIITAAADPVNLGAKTIAEFLSLKNAKDTCILTGAVKNIVMDSQDPTKPNKYGNFDLQDQTGTVYIYGLLTSDGQAQKFQEMDIVENDVITIKALYAEYNNNPQVKNAILVSVQKQATAVENIEQIKVTKIIRNGQVLILRDGIEYNMLGAEVQ